MYRNERALQRATIQWLTEFGGRWEVRSPGPFSEAGIADIIGCYQGRYVAIELKHPRTGRLKDLDPIQRVFLQTIVQNGGYALATNSLKVVEMFMARVSRAGPGMYLEALP